jgi:DNA-binding MarR family transcriptional regulator
MKRTSEAPKSSLIQKPPLTASPSGNLGKVLSLIKAHPGIRPSEINQRLQLEQSDALRDTLIKRGLVRKEKDGSAMRYYAV